MADGHILVVDDEIGMQQYLKKLLSKNDYKVSLASNGLEALDALQENSFQLALIDLKMPKMDGITLLQKIKDLEEQIPVIMMTAYGTMENAIKAMKLGAYDYVNKPFDIDEILIVIDKALKKRQLEEENSILRKTIEESYTFDDILSKNNQMLKIFDLVKNISDAKSHVLIQGETGTGKELIARAIHNSSKLRSKPFVPVDCAALSESLLESELFGHVKGAFTGATADKKGLFESADGGTVFLDEIGHISLQIQVKLLRVLQDQKIKRVGDARSKKINIRLIAASNENLDKAVKEGRFREDLYYRINVVLIDLPPLRRRREDIPLLVDFFIAKYNRLERKNIQGITDETLKVLMNYDWPGNVRELENLIHRAVVIKKTSIINPRDLPANVNVQVTAERRDLKQRTVNFNKAKKQVIEAFEIRFLISVLKACNGNVSKVAKEVGLDRRNLQRKFKEYKISPKDYQQ